MIGQLAAAALGNLEFGLAAQTTPATGRAASVGSEQPAAAAAASDTATAAAASDTALTTATTSEAAA